MPPGRYSGLPSPGPQVGVEEVLGFPASVLLGNRKLLLEQVNSCKIWRWDRTKLETHWKCILAEFDKMYASFVEQEFSSGAAEEISRENVLDVLQFCSVLIRNCMDPLSYNKSLKVFLSFADLIDHFDGLL